MSFPRQVVCLLGPSVAFNREVVLIQNVEPGGRASWELPSFECEQAPEQPIIAYLSETFGLKAVRHDLRGRCDRWSTSGVQAISAHLYSVLIPKEPYSGLMERLGPSSAQPRLTERSFRDVFHHSPDLDWCTLGMIMHVFYHLER